MEAINLEFEKELQQQQTDLETLVTQIQAMQADPAVSDFTKQSKISKYESTVEETQSNINNLMEKIDEKTQDVVAETTSIKDKDSKISKKK